MADNLTIEEYLKPDGSIDWDRWMLADPKVPPLELNAKRDELRKELRAYSATKKLRETPRVAQALSGAPVAKDIASLAEGSSAVPEAPDAAAAALERLRSKPRLNSSGVDLGADTAPLPPPRSGLPKPLEYDPEAMPNMVPSDAARPTRELPPPTGTSSSRGVMGSLDPSKQRIDLTPRRPAPTPDEWASPPETATVLPSNVEWGADDQPEQLTPGGKPYLSQSAIRAQMDKYAGQETKDPGLTADQLMSMAGQGERDSIAQMKVREADMNVAADDAKWAKLRKGIGRAVDQSKIDTLDSEMALAHDRDANALEKRMATPAGAAAKSRPAARPPLATGAGEAPAPERPQFGKDFLTMAAEQSAPSGQASARQPLGAVEQMVTGAAPPDTSKDEAELAAAQKRRDEEAFLAQVASQFGHYADVQGGTETGDRGATVREAAENPLRDLKAKQALRQQAFERQQEGEDRAFTRQGLLEDRQAKIAKRKQEGDYNDGKSEISRRRRAQVVAMYPDLVTKIDPKVWLDMSAADVDTFFKEAAPSKMVKGGGSGGVGMSPAQMNSLRNKLPQHLVDTYNAIGRVKSMAQSMGGWEKTKTGIAGGFMPSVFMDNDTRALRQELGGVVARFLQAGGGKSITANEERVLISRIAADPTSSNLRPADLERGLAIIERSMAGDTRQALAGAPQGAKQALLGDMGISNEWVGQDLQAPLKNQPRPQQPKVAVGERRVDKNGKLRERRADGWHLVEGGP